MELDKYRFEFDKTALELVLLALGQLPYARVSPLVDGLMAEIRRQDAQALTTAKVNKVAAELAQDATMIEEGRRVEAAAYD